MYEYLPNAEVNGTNSLINKSFCDGNVKNGKELLTSLMKPVAYIARSIAVIKILFIYLILEKKIY